MAKPLVTDELWEVIESLLPEEPPKPKGGRPRVPDRAALTGIIFVLKTGIPWEMLPQQMDCGCGMTCWHDLLATPQGVARGRGVRAAPKDAARSPRQGGRDRLGACIFGLGERAGPRGGQKTGPNPTDRGKSGSKRHVVLDRDGVPLAVIHTAANVHDSKALRKRLWTPSAADPEARPRTPA